MPVIDLFAGPGGLGEGFASAKHGNAFRIALSVEKDLRAYQTLRLRATYRSLTRRDRKKFLAQVCNGGIDHALSLVPKALASAELEALNHELGRGDPDLLRDVIRRRTKHSDCCVLVGGPPCQAYSLVGRARNKGIAGYRLEDDERHDLYKHYLKVISDHWPAVFVMENVKGLLSASLTSESVFQRILSDLENPAGALRVRTDRRHRYRLVAVGNRQTRPLFDGLHPSDFVVRAEDHGVPQTRHRLIVIGIREDLGPLRLSKLEGSPPIPATAVLSDLPRLRSGISEGSETDGDWKDALRMASSSQWFRQLSRIGQGDVQDKIGVVLGSLRAPAFGRGGECLRADGRPSYAPEWYAAEDHDVVFNHQARAHIVADLHRYLFVSCYGTVRGRSPRLSDFPADLRPDHRNAKLSAENGGLFSDRFRVQLRDRPASTITSHISKDGHYFVHYDPSQCRSLTVREAARLQTFPDDYLFCGPRTSQYAQVGNAVPPLLAKAIAEAVGELLAQAGA